jgi:hypothetical protein
MTRRRDLTKPSSCNSSGASKPGVFFMRSVLRKTEAGRRMDHRSLLLSTTRREFIRRPILLAASLQLGAPGGT